MKEYSQNLVVAENLEHTDVQRILGRTSSVALFSCLGTSTFIMCKINIFLYETKMINKFLMENSGNYVLQNVIVIVDYSFHKFCKLVYLVSLNNLLKFHDEHKH